MPRGSQDVSFRNAQRAALAIRTNEWRSPGVSRRPYTTRARRTASTWTNEAVSRSGRAALERRRGGGATFSSFSKSDTRVSKRLRCVVDAARIRCPRLRGMHRASRPLGSRDKSMRTFFSLHRCGPTRRRRYSYFRRRLASSRSSHRARFMLLLQRRLAAIFGALDPAASSRGSLIPT